MSDVGRIMDKICEKAGLTKEEVKKKISEKQDELSGLVSEEGAAYIVAREFGINLLKETKRQLKIKNLLSGLRSVDLVGRIIRVFEPLEFERNGKKGKVANVLIADETGMVRLSLWDEEVNMIKEGDLQENDTVRITNGYVKMDNRGNPELRLGKGNIEKVEADIDVPDIKEMEKKYSAPKRKQIRDLKEGEFAEIKATLVQIFKRNLFYEVCPMCGARLKEEGEKWICKEHGGIEPDYHMVVSGVIDDDTGNIRAVFFRDVAEKLLGKKADELRKLVGDEKDAVDVYKYTKALGNDFVVRGRVKKNELTGNLEFIANDVCNIDVKKECENLIKELENKAEQE